MGLRYVYEQGSECPVAIVNSDIIFCEPDTFFRLLKASDSKEQIGVVMPMVWNVHHRIKDPAYQIQIRRCENSVLDVLVDGSPLIRPLFSGRFSRNMYKNAMPFKQTMACEVVSGACFLMLNNLVRHRFLFDDGVFLYHEEYMLCRYMMQKGLTALFVSEVKVQHLQGMSGEQKQRFSLRHHQFKIKAHVYYMKQYLGVNSLTLFLYRVFKWLEGLLIYLLLNRLAGLFGFERGV